MAKLFIHAGTHKTGTTSIQRFLRDNRTNLEKHHIIYPIFDHEAGHHGLTSDWIDLPDKYSYKSGSKVTLNHLAEKYEKTNFTVLVSSEEFSRIEPNSVDFNEIMRIFENFSEIKYIICFRDQCSLLQSIYCEVSKHTVPSPPEKIIKNLGNMDAFYGVGLNYNKNMEKFQDQYPRIKYTAFQYESSSSKSSNIEKFVSILSNDYPGLNSLYSSPEKKFLNTANQALLVRLKNLYQSKHSKNISQENIRKILSLNKFPPHLMMSSIFSELQYQQIVSHFEKINAPLFDKNKFLGEYSRDWLLDNRPTYYYDDFLEYISEDKIIKMIEQSNNLV